MNHPTRLLSRGFLFTDVGDCSNELSAETSGREHSRSIGQQSHKGQSRSRGWEDRALTCDCIWKAARRAQVKSKAVGNLSSEAFPSLYQVTDETPINLCLSQALEAVQESLRKQGRPLLQVTERTLTRAQGVRIVA